MGFPAVVFAETYQNIVVCLRQIVDDAVDIRFRIFGAVDIDMFVCGNMQRIGNAEMIPEQFVQRGVFVDPDNFLDRYNRNAVFGGFDKEMLRNKHIFRS